MTVLELIQNIDNLKPNRFSFVEKVRWLNELETNINNTMLLYQDVTSTFDGYSEQSGTSELIIKPPYDRVYEYWIMAQIDLYNQEIDRYNNSIAMFNQAYSEWVNNFNKTHLAKSTQTIKRGA